MRILRLLARFVGYAFTAALLTALGTVVFFWVRYQPRANLPATMEVLQLSPDGNILLGEVGTNSWHFRVKSTAPPNAGDLQVWDTRQARHLRDFASPKQLKRSYYSMPAFLAEWNPILTIDDDHGLRVIDWKNKQDTRVPFREAHQVRVADLSPKGRWLVADTKAGTRFLLDTTGERQPTLLTGNLANLVRFSPDDSLLFFRASKFFRDADALLVCDGELGREQIIRLLPEDTFTIAPNSKWLALSRDSRKPPKIDENQDVMMRWLMGAWTREFEFRELPSCEPRGRVNLPAFGLWICTCAPHSNCAAIWRADAGSDVNLVVAESPSGRTIAQVRIPTLRSATFSPDGALLLCETVKERQIMVDAANGKRLWEKETAAWLAFYGQDGNQLVFQENHERPYQLLDARTGAVRVMLPLDFPTANHLPSFTPDGRRLVIRGWRQLQREPYFWECWLAKWLPDLFGDQRESVIVVDTATGTELLRLLNRAQLGNGRFLSDDGEVLVTTDGDEDDPGSAVISVWEVSPRRARRWALAVVAAAFVAGLVVRTGWKKWRRPRPVPSGS